MARFPGKRTAHTQTHTVKQPGRPNPADRGLGGTLRSAREAGSRAGSSARRTVRGEKTVRADQPVRQEREVAENGAPARPEPLTRREARTRKKVAARQERAGKRDAKATVKAAKKSSKLHKKVLKAERKGNHGRVTPGNTKKFIAVSKIVAPVLAPFVMQAATVTRERYDRIRARRIGVAVEDLANFTGRGAALHARIAGDAEALRDLRDLREKAENDEAEGHNVEQFVEGSRKRLDQLTSAVRAAERMPTARRRAAHRAVHGELERIEEDLLNRFGI